MSLDLGLVHLLLRMDAVSLPFWVASFLWPARGCPRFTRLKEKRFFFSLLVLEATLISSGNGNTSFLG